MRLTEALMDRACGVVLGSAVGDALGAGYEFTSPAVDLAPEMIGGGIGRFAPGEWTDDTAQAAAIARVAATGIDLRADEALDAIAAGFLEWLADGPSDIGIQTSKVLRRAAGNPTAAGMAAAAKTVHDLDGRSAGNGSLMRTGPVALGYLDDPAGLVEAAMRISALTHYEDIAQEGCAVWCLLIHHTVLTAELPTFDDIATWVPNPEKWRAILDEAANSDPSTFTTNGWVVGAMQAAWSAITRTRAAGPEHFVEALGAAIRVGHDTDTVAAIAGALLGARWGMTAIPTRWRRMLHGWPRATAHDLEEWAVLAARGGRPLGNGWPGAVRLDPTPYEAGRPALVQHPYDDGVWLGSASALDRLPESVDVVVSLSLTGSEQVPAGIERISFRLIDDADPSKNSNLDFVIDDIVGTIAALRAEGHGVLVHCVAAHSRTPLVGTAYAMSLGVPLTEALTAVCGALPAASINGGFQAALSRYAATLDGRI